MEGSVRELHNFTLGPTSKGFSLYEIESSQPPRFLTRYIGLVPSVSCDTPSNVAALFASFSMTVTDQPSMADNYQFDLGGSDAKATPVVDCLRTSLQSV